MESEIDLDFAETAATEAPLVIAYIVTLILLGFAWSSFSSPELSITELSSTPSATNSDRRYELLP